MLDSIIIKDRPKLLTPLLCGKYYSSLEMPIQELDDLRDCLLTETEKQRLKTFHIKNNKQYLYAISTLLDFSLVKK